MRRGLSLANEYSCIPGAQINFEDLAPNLPYATAEAVAAEVRDPGEVGEDAEGGQREGQADGAGEGGGRTGAPKNIYH